MIRKFLGLLIEIFVAKERGSYYWILLIVQPDLNQPPTQFSLIKDAYPLLAIV